MAINIACLQMGLKWADEEFNIRRVLKEIDKLWQGNDTIDIICLPELFTTGFDYDYLKNRGKGITDCILQRLSKKARDRGIYIIAGTLPETENSRLYNTLFVIDQRGEIIESYRKIHLFPLMGEDRFFSSGERIITFNTPWANIGVAVCYDLRFPDLFQTMAKAGAKVIFLPAQFPSVRIRHWDILLRARAIENQIFMVGVNRVGEDPMGSFSGHTAIFNPMGDLVAGCSVEEGWIIGAIDINEVDRVRRDLPTLFYEPDSLRNREKEFL